MISMFFTSCLLLSISWEPSTPELDLTVKEQIQEAWKEALVLEESGSSHQESLGHLSEAVKVVENRLGREKLILQCVLIMADLQEVSGQNREFMEVSVTMGQIIQPTPDELISVLAPLWPMEDGSLRKLIRGTIQHATVMSYDKTRDSSLFAPLTSILSAAWSQGSNSHNGLVDYMYSVDPVEAWQAMIEIKGKQDAECGHMLAQLHPVLRVVNSGFLRESDVQADETREKASTILRECLECGSLWAKIFVAEILLRVESLREEDLLRALKEEESPFIGRRLNLIEQEEKQNN